ncbi:MAG TPA: D-2-hydroxyacid dehydrogenase family protein [Burkholderiales bacterium]|nr:D-2-hydroxyacid dehydrogenase family protein [Burkholderiales bacterium]
MKIAVLDDYQDALRGLACYARLAGHEVRVYRDTLKEPAALAARIGDADAVVLTQQRSAFPRALIEALPQLKLVSLTGRNARHVDVEACTHRGIAVSVARGVGNPSAPAELAWALILSSLRNIPAEVQRLKEGRWQGSVGVGLKGKTLGIYAYGRIGSMVARVGEAFGMRVVCWGREGSTQRAREAGFEVAADRRTFFESADVVSLHLPMKPETRGIVTAEDLAHMKSTALLVNVSRARLIAEGVLAAALKQGRPGRAAVDVYEDEPVLDANHPLVVMDNVTCTPHLGYVEQSTYEAYYGAAVDNIVAYAAGAPTNVINPEVLARD